MNIFLKNLKVSRHRLYHIFLFEYFEYFYLRKHTLSSSLSFPWTPLGVWLFCPENSYAPEGTSHSVWLGVLGKV